MKIRAIRVGCLIYQLSTCDYSLASSAPLHLSVDASLWKSATELKVTLRSRLYNSFGQTLTHPENSVLTLLITGGGSGGHVLPNLPIISRARAAGWTVFYVGSGDGPEKELIGEAGLPFFPIICGKIRRERWISNGISIVRTLLGVIQCLVLVSRLRPDVIFSKGGYVSVPVTLAAWFRRVPVVIHESDVSPGLANRIAARFARRICTTFDETTEFFPRSVRRRIICTGMPLREEILRGDAERGRQLCGFTKELPCLLVMGGSLGSERINKVVESALPDLLARFQIAHLTGKGKSLNVENHARYRQFEFSRDIHHLLAMADVVVSRAGASAIIEILAARKPSILLPLSSGISRGEQIENASYWAEKGVMRTIENQELHAESLTRMVFEVFGGREKYLNILALNEVVDGTEKILSLLARSVKWRKSARKDSGSDTSWN